MLKQRLNSFRYAFEGLFDLVKSQPNAKIHLFATTVVIIAGFYFSISPTEWMLVTLAIVGVLSAEAFNTALEYLTDLVSPDYHLLAKKTKDVAAAGVLIMAFGAIIIGLIIFLPRILALIP
ncbi:MAG: diacylglycerol kinase family protein [Bacteroidota bacterium]